MTPGDTALAPPRIDPPPPPRPGRWRRLVQQVPFTTLLIAAVLVVSAAAGLLVRPISADQLERWGFGITDVFDGGGWHLLSAPFLILRPYMALTISAILLFFVGTCELMLRTRRTVVVFVIAHVIGYTGAVALLTLLGHVGLAGATALGQQRDVGASNGAFGAAGALMVFLPPQLRLVGGLALGAYLAAALVIEQQLWDVQHILAFSTGALVGTWFLWKDRRDLSGLRQTFTVLHRRRAAVLAWLVGGMGAVNVLAALLLPHHAGFERLEALIPLGLENGPRHLLLASGLLLMLLATGLRRAQRVAWWAAFFTLLVAFVLQLELGITKIEALFAFLFMVMLVAWKEDFPAASDPSTEVSRPGLGAAMLGLPFIAWFWTLALHTQFLDFPGGATAFVDVLRRLFFLPALELVPIERRGAWLLEAIPVVFWTLLVILVLESIRAVRAPRARRTDRVRSRELVLRHGRTSTAFMTTWPHNSYFFDASGRCMVAYRVQFGIAVALGDPIGPTELRGRTLTEFAAYCASQGWQHVILAATGSERSIYEAGGYSLLQIGQEAILPLEHLEFKGKKWQNMRSALNRAERLGMRFVLVEGARVGLELEPQLFEISREWEGSLKLPPMGFTLGRVEDVRDPEVEVAIAVDATGQVHGFVDWLPVPAERGWVIDLMRRRGDAMSGTMEYLIGMSILAFQQRGERFVSLATAPLAGLDREDDQELLPRILGRIYTSFGTYYNFQSLFDFKDRFQPLWEPVYLAYPDAMDLPRAAVAIVRVHLPRMGSVDLVRLFGETLAERLRPAGEED